MRTSIKYVLIFFAIVAILGIGLTLVSGDADARTCVWDGEGADALASNPLNWDDDLAPIGNATVHDCILFDGLHLVNASADDPCTWDMANDSFGTFTIDAAYSGTITESSDMHIQGFSMAGGIFTGINTKWVYCSGDLVLSGGIFTREVSNIELSGTDKLLSATFKPNQLTIPGSYTVNANREIYFPTGGIINVSGSLILGDVNARIVLNSVSPNSRECQNSINGAITGIGYFELFAQYQDATILGDYHGVAVKVKMDTRDGANGNRVITMGCAQSFLGPVDMWSMHATYTFTLNSNGYNLTAPSITVGIRGILQCGEGTITTGALTSTSGTITEETATWVFTNATVTATSGEKFYNVHMNGWCDFVSSVNVTNDLRFINVPTDYQDIDVYLDTVYSQTIASPYSWGAGNTVGAKYEYEPDVQITMSQFYEDADFSIYAYISSNLPVTYNITGTAADWLSYHEGRIVGMPPDIGNYTYTITANHESGSQDIVNGYIIVGQVTDPEYSFDFVWGLLLWSVITLFMLFAFIKEIPLMQMVVWAISFGNIVATIRIDNFEAFVALFAICNTIMFFIGMARWRS